MLTIPPVSPNPSPPSKTSGGKNQPPQSGKDKLLTAMAIKTSSPPLVPSAPEELSSVTSAPPKPASSMFKRERQFQFVNISKFTPEKMSEMLDQLQKFLKEVNLYVSLKKIIQKMGANLENRDRTISAGKGH